MLVLVVGPSGAGKDTLLEAARQALAGDRRFRFVRRVITRPADAGGEAHEAVTSEEFAGRQFALQWQAHGLSYGIPADAIADIARGKVVVANASRTVVAAAARRFPTRVIEVMASPDVLAKRLASRSREDAADVARRLARSVALPADVATVTIVNDGTLEEGVARFLAAVRGCAG
jgi:phosphonate metabolism protein PhnN/1,5-bisphosphokinase (PRPP-forming)